MMGHTPVRLTLLASLLMAAGSPWPFLAESTAAEKLPNLATPVRIGMVGSFFRDTPEQLVTTMMQPFGALMESQTGITGQLVFGGDAANLGEMLSQDKVHLAVFHGIEFGWARQKFPDIRPMVIAVNQHRHLRAVVLVLKESGLDRFADLKGKDVALPKQSREHCHLFLERRCRDCGLEPKQLFGKIVAPANVEEALDDVVDGAVQAAIIDGVSLECYQRRKPARFARLKTLDQSEIFPAAVVAFHPGGLDEGTLRQFREGMINANKAPLGRQFMTLWKMSGFEAIPADYEQIMTEILKCYPAPRSEKAQVTVPTTTPVQGGRE
jgi:ABC-type phosphate/phosphonate transport system substrate-binding protein